MLRVNHIISILGRMKPYAPYTYQSRLDKTVSKLQGSLLATTLLLFALLFILVMLYKLTASCHSNPVLYTIFGLYFIGTLTGLVMMLLPPILGIQLLKEWEKNASNEFACEVSHDEENAKRLLPYSEKELDYATYCLQLRMNRLNIRVSNFFGEKTATVSFLGLVYTAVHSTIGFENLSQSFTKGLFQSGAANTFVTFGLALLLGLSLGALMLKKVAQRLQYLKEIVELAVRIKQETGEGY